METMAINAVLLALVVIVTALGIAIALAIVTALFQMVWRGLSYVTRRALPGKRGGNRLQESPSTRVEGDDVEPEQSVVV